MRLDTTALHDPAILLDMNNAAVPDVNALDLAKASWLVSHAVHARVALLDGQAVGVLVVLNDTADLDSDYYRWWTSRYEHFLYIDRVVVAAWARGCGVASELYREVDHLAAQHQLAIAAEVYSEPANVASLHLHRSLGYRQVGSQYSTAEGKMVSKLMKSEERARPVSRAIPVLGAKEPCDLLRRVEV